MTGEAAPPGPLRAFVAVFPPREVADTLVASCGELVPTLSGARPSAAERLHVTLAFIGQMPHASMAAATRALAVVAEAHLTPALHLRVTGAGAFPSAGRATVLWAGVEGATAREDARLARLAKHTRIGLRQVRVIPERTPFRPHLTLARMPRQSAGEQIAALSAQLRTLAGELTFEACCVRLMESRPGGGYVVLASSGPASGPGR